jgi:hypothetical protein
MVKAKIPSQSSIPLNIVGDASARGFVAKGHSFHDT